jgi:hypothetical protein
MRAFYIRRSRKTSGTLETSGSVGSANYTATCRTLQKFVRAMPIRLSMGPPQLAQATWLIQTCREQRGQITDALPLLCPPSLPNSFAKSPIRPPETGCEHLKPKAPLKTIRAGMTGLSWG